MFFLKSNSINEILNTPLLDAYFSLLFPGELLDFVPGDLKDAPLEEVASKVITPWGAPFMADELLYAANAAYAIVNEGKYRFMSLWRNAPTDYIPQLQKNNKESVCLLARNNANSQKRPAAIICPGGGYEMLSAAAEGVAMAEKMDAAGYCPFVLFYRLKPNYYPEPQKDLALAMKYVRANAETFGIDSNNVMVIGSSAGGHLCASFTAYYEDIHEALMKNLESEAPAMAEEYRGISIRPNAVCLNYPVISFMEETHEPSFQALTGGAEELRDKLSIDRHLDAAYPKTFVWACEDDALVPFSNAVRMGEALKKQGVPYRLKIYPTGGHGCGLANGTSAEGWMDEMLEFMKQQ